MLKGLQLHRIDRWLPALFFTVLLFIGIAIHGDYGLSWDDPTQRRLGLATWDYLLGKNDDLFANENSFINPFVGLLEVLPEKMVHPESEREAYRLHHLANFILCWAGLIFFYLLGLRLFRDYRFALLACLLFVLTPRLFAHCFYNSKDLSFLFLFVANVYLLVAWTKKPSWGTTAGMVICSGILTATRVAGVLFPIMVVLAVAFSALSQKMKRSEVKMIIVYLLLYPLSVYLFFPTIWHDPVSKFFNALELYSHHPYDVTTFFMGETVHSLHTPWYYIPVWMAITIPLGWWIFFWAGIILLIAVFLRERIRFSIAWLIIMLWLLIPLAAVFILHSNHYEDGRHLFFIEPALLLIAVFGIQQLLQAKYSTPKILSRLPPILTAVVLVITISYTTVFMFQSHPYQYVYFNSIGRKYAVDYFEKDYWGLSFRNALEFLVKYDHSDSMNVRWKIDPGEWNLVWLDEKDQQRIHHVPYDQCDYYITNYRSHHPVDASDEKIYEIKVQGIIIMAVYKMHPPNGSPNPSP